MQNSCKLEQNLEKQSWELEMCKLRLQLEQRTLELSNCKSELAQSERTLQVLKEYTTFLRGCVHPDRRPEKTEVVYIVTNKAYAAKNMFRIGGVSSWEHLDAKLNFYNGGETTETLFYFAFKVAVSDFRAVEKWVDERLAVPKNDAGMYHINLFALIDHVKHVVDSHNTSVELNNQKLSELLDSLNPLSPALQEHVFDTDAEFDFDDLFE